MTAPQELTAAVAEVLAGVPEGVLRTRTAALVAAYRGATALPPDLLGTPEAAAAYAGYRMPATHAATRQVLREAVAACPGLAPASVVDVGGGSGAALWAAVEAFPSLRDAVVVDRSAPALALGRQLATRSSSPVVAGARWVRQELTGPTAVPDADLAVLAYVLAELTDPAARALLAAVAQAASTVVVVEPGTPAGHEHVLRAREQLLALGFAVAAPCPHAGRCPLREGPAWCHSSVRLDRSPLHRRLKDASLGFEDEKLSYVVATRSPGLVGGVVPAERVVSRPRVRGGAVELEVCGRDGEVRPVRVLKRHLQEFGAARSLRWGSRWEPAAAPSTVRSASSTCITRSQSLSRRKTLAADHASRSSPSTSGWFQSSECRGAAASSVEVGWASVAADPPTRRGGSRSAGSPS